MVSNTIEKYIPPHLVRGYKLYRKAAVLVAQYKHLELHSTDAPPESIEKGPSSMLVDLVPADMKVITSAEPEPMVDTLNALVFEPRLWSVANVRTQNDLLHFLQRYVHGPKRRLCRTRFGVRHFVEWIDRFYAYGPSPPPAPDYRPPIAEMQQLRNIIRNICTDYLSQSATSDEVYKIMAPL
ncbi:hypothetical protein SeLEV6574_g08463 [Synchytrium endobioticum]|uniref:DUF4704 domain-containing protein n=1 Tax=Synchytrium endobioticum TaxID=286115 RepID=A0A507BZV9_9FUNG|nr:hypothetical protein SeLEV6574_g08463 [Synchytrium endobioticum]